MLFQFLERNRSFFNERRRSVFVDDGGSWSPPRRTNIWGYPPDTLQLQDGRVVRRNVTTGDQLTVRFGVDKGHLVDELMAENPPAAPPAPSTVCGFCQGTDRTTLTRCDTCGAEGVLST